MYAQTSDGKPGKGFDPTHSPQQTNRSSSKTSDGQTKGGDGFSRPFFSLFISQKLPWAYAEPIKMQIR